MLHISPHDHELVEARRAWAAGEYTDDYRQNTTGGSDTEESTPTKPNSPSESPPSTYDDSSTSASTHTGTAWPLS